MVTNPDGSIHYLAESQESTYQRSVKPRVELSDRGDSRVNRLIIHRAQEFGPNLKEIPPCKELRAAYCALPPSCHEVLAGKEGNDDQQRQYYRLLRALTVNYDTLEFLETKDLEWLCKESLKINIPPHEIIYCLIAEERDSDGLEGQWRDNDVTFE